MCCSQGPSPLVASLEENGASELGAGWGGTLSGEVGVAASVGHITVGLAPSPATTDLGATDSSSGAAIPVTLTCVADVVAAAISDVSITGVGAVAADSVDEFPTADADGTQPPQLVHCRHN